MSTDPHDHFISKPREIAERIATGADPPFLIGPLVGALIKRLAMADAQRAKPTPDEPSARSRYDLLVEISDFIAESRLYLPERDAGKCVPVIVQVLKEMRQQLQSGRSEMTGSTPSDQTQGSRATDSGRGLS